MGSEQARKPTTIELEEGWAEMQKGIVKLKRLLEGDEEEQFKPDQYMTLYTIIYNMCTQKPPHDYSEQLYNRYKEVFHQYIQEQVLPSLDGLRNEQLLTALYRRWTNHKVMVRWLSRFFNYLDRYYIVRHCLYNLQDVGLLAFRDYVYVELKVRACDAILDLVARERDGEIIDRSLIKNVLDIFIEVGMGSMDNYEADFEARLLEQTGLHCRKQAASWFAEDSCPEYLCKAEAALAKEEERVDKYLHASTKTKLLGVVETELLARYEKQLIEKEASGCAALLRDDKRDDLARMYRLFSRVPSGPDVGLEPVAAIFEKHVEEQGLKLVKEVTEAAQARRDKDAGKQFKGGEGSHEQLFIKGVIELHDKYLGYVNGCFSNSSLFHKALKNAFESFCNKQVANSSMSELMATFCDNLLKKGGSEKLSDDAVEDLLDKVVRLLAYISDKDLFSEFYRKKLARRLLSERSASDDHERSILTRLKQQCGAAFTSKMEGMVTDLALAREKQQLFSTWREGKNKGGVDVVVTVLTTGFWPHYKQMDVALPNELMAGVEQFKEFYEVSNSNRKLNWYYTLGTCTVKAQFERTYEFVLSTMQAALLTLFNDDDDAVLTMEDVKTRLNVTDEEAARLLHSLSCAKYKILLKSPESRTVSTGDAFRINNKFADRARRIKVPLPPVDERKKVVEDVAKDRQYAIDAAIVRTMKSRKQLAHQQLVMEVMQQLQRMFTPDFRLIKKRIEDLIEREFLERDKDNNNLYRYLA